MLRRVCWHKQKTSTKTCWIQPCAVRARHRTTGNPGRLGRASPSQLTVARIGVRAASAGSNTILSTFRVGSSNKRQQKRAGSNTFLLTFRVGSSSKRQQKRAGSSRRSTCTDPCNSNFTRAGPAEPEPTYCCTGRCARCVCWIRHVFVDVFLSGADTVFC